MSETPEDKHLSMSDDAVRVAYDAACTAYNAACAAYDVAYKTATAAYADLALYRTDATIDRAVTADTALGIARTTRDTALAAARAAQIACKKVSESNALQGEQVSAERLNESLFEAANKGDANSIRELIAKGANPNARDEKEASPLHFAALNGHRDAVSALLIAKADVHARDTKGPKLTPLHLAAGSGHSDIITILLDYGPTEVNAGDVDGDTPLHYAAMGGHPAAVIALLARNASPIAKGAGGRTPISVAAEGCLKGASHFIDTIKALTAKPTKETEAVLDNVLCRHWSNYTPAIRSALNQILEDVRQQIKGQLES